MRTQLAAKDAEIARLRGENDQLRERLLQQDGWHAQPQPRAEEQTELFSVTETVTFPHAVRLLWMLLWFICCWFVVLLQDFEFLACKQGDNTDDVCAVTVEPEQSVIVGR